MLNLCQMPVDWTATGTMLQGIGTIIGAIAVIWGAFNAADVWKEQKRLERRLEMAERILTATHKGRHALRYIRGPMLWAAELSAAEDQLKADGHWAGQPEDRRKRLTTAQALLTRINKTKDEQSALDDCLPMARALFNEELEKAVEKLNRQFWIVQVDIESYVDDWNGTDAEFSAKIRRGMYEMRAGDEANEVTDAISAAVATIERICLPALRLDPIKRDKFAEAQIMTKGVS